MKALDCCAYGKKSRLWFILGRNGSRRQWQEGAGTPSIRVCVGGPIDLILEKDLKPGGVSMSRAEISFLLNEEKISVGDGW